VKTHRLTLLLVAICALASAAPLRAEPSWQTDFKKAQEEAKNAHKFLLVEFTGSDWCPPCMRLRQEVLATREFQDYAGKNYILVELDFPRHKTQTPELTKQNQELAYKFGIEAFPSLLIFNSEGKKVGELMGYDPGMGVSGYIAELEKARKS
jgi:thioredoxin-related protein